MGILLLDSYSYRIQEGSCSWATTEQKVQRFLSLDNYTDRIQVGGPAPRLLLGQITGRVRVLLLDDYTGRIQVGVCPAEHTRILLLYHTDLKRNKISYRTKYKAIRYETSDPSNVAPCAG